MNRLLIVAASGLIFLSACKTQEIPLTPAQRTEAGYAHSSHITADFLKPVVYTLADDSMRGRDTGSPEEVKAAIYLANNHILNRLQPAGDDSTYFQFYDLATSVTRGYTFKFTTGDITQTMKVDSDNLDPVLVTAGSPGTHQGQIVFAGFGIEDSTLGIRHLDGIDIRGHYVLIFNDIPAAATGWNAQRRFRDLILTRGALGVITISLDSPADFLDNLNMMQRNFGSPTGMRLAYQVRQPRFTYQYYTITPFTASQLLAEGNEQSLRDLHTTLSANPQNFSPRVTTSSLSVDGVTGEETIQSRNVVAVLPGSDPELAHEAVVLMAHYDHVGIGSPDAAGDRLYNGADDNASGTAGLLAIANALVEAKKAGHGPRRSVMFLHVSGEEKGLLGSRYYSDHPTIPIENVVANINVDMVGRIEDKRYESGDTNYVYLIGASLISSRIDSLVRVANSKTTNVFLDPGYNDLNDPQQIYRRSDHWNFGRLGIPFAFFFSGLHADYHQPSDTADKIAYEVLANRLKMIYGLTIEIANDTERPVVDNKAFIERTQASPR